ncbi:CFS1-like protein [Pholiota conissans]|uniref:CFS1-like protein n=1 Tax=Pholiota conissans TaxID=109636 RepID=A0A9P6CWY8_9AGAR|nr:CFS1-like protein [Pholiota conissans]
MQNIKVGQLRVLTYSHIYTFPIPEPGNVSKSANRRPDLKAELRVVNDSFWVRLCAMGDLGFSEAYMYGDVECDDLVSLFDMFLENREYLSNLDSRLSYLFTLPQKITSYRFLNTIGNSRSNISAHYDISNDMFAGFLSEDMTYSCAIFPELDGDLTNDKSVQSRWSGGQALKRVAPSPLPIGDTKSADILSHPSPESDPLYDAQMRKLQHIIDKLHIPASTPTSAPMRVLEIGTGWGALAIRLTEQFTHVEVDTITLSSAQKALAEKRIAARGLSGRIRVHLMDYRNMPKDWEGRFARFVSVEMIEAVGREFLEQYWRVVDWAMEKKGAVGVVQVISIPEARFERYIQEIDFIRKWVSFFPGGFLPTLTFLMSTLAAGSQGRLVVETIANIGPHYARTLREWRRRFVARFETVVVPSLQKEYAARTGGGKDGKPKMLGRDEIEVFRRKWLYYYCYCEVGFTTRTLGDHILTFMREGNREYGSDVYE